MYMPKQMEPGCELFHDFCQFLATQMTGHRADFIEYAERWSMSHENICPHRDFVPMPAYRCTPLNIESPVIEGRPYPDHLIDLPSH
jgi:hypothetical protein